MFKHDHTVQYKPDPRFYGSYINIKLCRALDGERSQDIVNWCLARLFNTKFRFYVSKQRQRKLRRIKYEYMPDIVTYLFINFQVWNGGQSLFLYIIRIPIICCYCG